MSRAGAKKASFLTRLIAVALAITVLLSTLYGCTLFSPSSSSSGSVAETSSNASSNTGSNEGLRPIQEIGDELFAHLLADDYSLYQQLIAHPTTSRVEKPTVSFGDYSFEAAKEEYDYYHELTSELAKYNTALLESNDQRLYGYLTYSLDTALALEEHFYLDDPYAPSVGTQTSLPLSLLTFSFRTQQDIDDYLTLVADIPRVLDQANTIVNERSTRNLYPNLAAVNSSIEEAQSYAADPASNVLVTSFEDALASDVAPFNALSPEQREQYASANRRVIADSIIPAYQKVISVLEGVASKTTNEVTLADQEGAQDYYAAAMRNDGFNQTPEEAIAELDASLRELATTFSANSSILLDTEEWERIVSKNVSADATEIISFLNTKMGEEFPDIGKRPFVVDSASDNEVVKMFTAFYLLAPVDDLEANRIGYYPQNLTGQYDLATTLAHESFPGHLYQYNYFGLTDPHPLEMLMGSTAYTEGYAVYSQSYALRYLGFTDEQAEALGSYELFLRALQARLDLGINYEGWSVAETEEYLDTWGLASLASEIYQDIASTPLVMLPYGLGPLKFYDLLEQAQKAKGNSFNLTEFHTVILEDGCLPFAFLDEKVSAWIG